MLLDFFKNNLVSILAVVAVVAFFYFGYSITTSSLKKLKTKVYPSYPFDLFFPHGGTWSVGYFLIIIILLGLLLYFMLKGNFYLQPA